MKQVKVRVHFYDIYDRIGEECFANITVEYDLNSIEQNGVNDKNVRIAKAELEGSTSKYLDSIDSNKTAWIEAAKKHISDDLVGAMIEDGDLTDAEADALWKAVE